MLHTRRDHYVLVGITYVLGLMCVEERVVVWESKGRLQEFFDIG
jgi:hypothetical protein